MIGERPSLEQIATSISRLSPDELRVLVEKRIKREPIDILPGIESGGMAPEDPADILIDSHEYYPKETVGLILASASLVNEWKDRSDERIQEDAEALRELLYLCAMLRVKDAIPSIFELARRESLARVILPGEADIQQRALQSLGGLLAHLTTEERGQYREPFERALDTPKQDRMMIGLNVLSQFWPDERDGFVERVKQHQLPNTEALIEFSATLVGSS